MPYNISFLKTDFTAKYTHNDGQSNIDSIAITGSNPDFGKLQVDDSDYTFGNAIDLDTQKLTFAASDTGKVQYLVSADAGSDIGLGPVILDITVTEITAPTITKPVAKSTTAGSTYTFTLGDFSSSCDLNNGTITSVTITPTNSSYGTWSKNGSAFSGTSSFIKKEIDSGYLKFKGTARRHGNVWLDGLQRSWDHDRRHRHGNG